jgi:lipid II:glycine glycyltransferase (peptidoglycan interpeptide bridge formation enzyme)
LENGFVYRLKEADSSQWNKLVEQCGRVNLLQTWEYGEAKRVVEGWEPVRYIVFDDNKPVGLVQILNKSLPLLGGIARINRGPLFLCNAIGDGVFSGIIKDTLRVVFQEIVKNKKNYLVIAPEIEESEANIRILEHLGFRSAGGISWSSSVLDLLLSEEALFKNLHGKWRNLLRKSEKMGLELEQTYTDEAMTFLMEKYNAVQREKRFAGVPKSILMELKSQTKSDSQVRIFFARKDQVRIAGILVVAYGDSCTYLVGWNTPDGRQLQANYFLLWRAIISFKESGCRWFDLGGLNKDRTPTIAHFKSGLGGRGYTLVGEWQAHRYSFIPVVIGLFGKMFNGLGLKTSLR